MDKSLTFVPLASPLQHGADPTKKNRDGNTPLDLVKDGDTDIQDLLRGDAALLDAAKKGCLARVQKLCSPDNINCRDTQGRNSTPLHLAGRVHAETRHPYEWMSCWLCKADFADLVQWRKKPEVYRWLTFVRFKRCSTWCVCFCQPLWLLVSVKTNFLRTWLSAETNLVSKNTVQRHVVTPYQLQFW